MDNSIPNFNLGNIKPQNSVLNSQEQEVMKQEDEVFRMDQLLEALGNESHIQSQRNNISEIEVQNISQSKVKRQMESQKAGWEVHSVFGDNWWWNRHQQQESIFKSDSQYNTQQIKNQCQHQSEKVQDIKRRKTQP